MNLREPTNQCRYKQTKALFKAEGMRETDHRLTTLPWAELWVSGSVFTLKIPTINYKKFKELKTSQERDTRNSEDNSIVFTSNKDMELWKLI